jgi:hypothetical protein
MLRWPKTLLSLWARLFKIPHPRLSALQPSRFAGLLMSFSLQLSLSLSSRVDSTPPLFPPAPLAALLPGVDMGGECGLYRVGLGLSAGAMPLFWSKVLIGGEVSGRGAPPVGAGGGLE